MGLDAATYEAIDLHATGTDAIARAFENQVVYCRDNGSPATALVCQAVGELLDGERGGVTMQRIRRWAGPPLADALPLRIAGALHALYLSGDEPDLAPIYEGLAPTDAADRIAAALERHDHALLPWLDGPPQTNEAGRSASFAAALLWLADGRTTAQFEWLEIGASAGINTMLGRYHYDLGGVTSGPGASRMRIAPEWRGPPPPQGDIGFVDARGCDIAPVDLTDEAQAMRLKSYVWPEATGRMARIDTAIDLARRMPPEIERMDAGDWARQELAKPQGEGVTRVVAHSIMWQYVPDTTQRQIEDTLQAAGEAATHDRPLAHLSLETNRETFAHELKVRYWPEGAEAVHLANAHPHGAWVEWLA